MASVFASRREEKKLDYTPIPFSLYPTNSLNRIHYRSSNAKFNLLLLRNYYGLLHLR